MLSPVSTSAERWGQIMDVKMVAVDMDGTFLRSDNTYDEQRFRGILERMEAAGCRFVVASGNQYYQLRDFFPGYDTELAFVAENGAFIKDRNELVFTGKASRETVEAVIDWMRAHVDEGVMGVMCGVDSAYIERGADPAFFGRMGVYYHRLAWVDDLKRVDDRILKFALTVPAESTEAFVDTLDRELRGHMVPTSSGHGDIDLIIPGCHKAWGLQQLAKRWGITADECIAFGDGGNDMEMLRWAGVGYAMDNAPANVKDAADEVCPSNKEDGVLEVLDMLF